MTRNGANGFPAIAHVVVLCSAVIFANPVTCEAWKVTTHMAVAEMAYARSDDTVRTRFAPHLRYLRAGAMGPDLFYFPPTVVNVPYKAPQHFGYWSNLAHYCQTDTLVRSLGANTAGDPELLAFVYGWFGHNVQDSVAHPWVNGWTGGPFKL